MGTASLSSKFSSLFLRVFLIVSWVLLALTTVYAIILTIWPNLIYFSSNNGLGVWENNSFGSYKIGVYGWVLIAIAGFSIIFSLIIQAIAKSVKYTIGKENRLLRYFSLVIFPLILFGAFAFVGTMSFSNSTIGLPGYENGVATLLFKSLPTTISFPFGTNNGTWVWLIMLVVAGINLVLLAFRAIKFFFSTIFSRTHDKAKHTK